MPWDKESLDAPHTEREIAMIEDSGSASNIKKPDIAMRYDFDAALTALSQHKEPPIDD